MASSRYYSFLNVLLFSVLICKNISNCNAEQQCLSRTFEKDQKIVIEYFFGDKVGSLSDDLCTITTKFNGLISLIYKMGGDVTGQDSTGKAICADSDCTQNRVFACNYKNDAEKYNNCNEQLAYYDSVLLAKCVCTGSADDILIANGAAYKNYGITILPALVLDGKYDPCFTDYTYDGMKKYICGVYQNALPVCT